MVLLLILIFGLFRLLINNLNPKKQNLAQQKRINGSFGKINKDKRFIDF